MMSAVNVTTNSGAALAFRLTTRGLVQIERHFDRPISDVLGMASASLSVEKVVVILGAAANNGAGCSEVEAFEMVDDLGGGVAAAAHVGKVVEAAFPVPEDADASGGAAKSGKSKAPVK
jgi:hypothetical protein